MQKIISFLSLIFISLFIQAQTISGSISGSVKDARNELIAGATINLQNTADSSLTRSTATTVNGRFQFGAVAAGTYRLSVSAVGQKSFGAMMVTVDDQHPSIIIPVIFMQPAKASNLAEVVVTAKKPLIEQEIDKTVVNVGSMISSASSNTLEVLEKTPGIIVGSNGDITLNGRGGVLVLIDGRSTYMSAQDLAAYLKSLPGSLIEKIELMDNPSARYDAGGNAVINIRLKRLRTAGTTGSISAGYNQGRYARTNEGLNLNYNQKKINLFTNLGYSKDANYNENLYDRRFYNAANDLVSTIALDNHQLTSSKGLSAIIGLDFMATTNTTYGFQVNINQTRAIGHMNYRSKSFTQNKVLDTIGTGNIVGNDKRRNLGSNVNFMHRFGKSGRELSADINYLNYHTNGNQSLLNFLSGADENITYSDEFIYLLPASYNIYTAKADYIHPFKNKAKLEVGFKSSVVNNDNNARYFDVLSGTEKIDNRKSNHFKYQENINAVYFNTQKAWKRIGPQFGLRIENTRATGRQLGNDSVQASSFKKNYTQLFPSFFLNYKLDSLGANSLTFSITRRINRPNYQSLNSFLFFRDRYSYSAGNPGLNPQYQYRYELRFVHKQFLRMGLSYNRFTDVIFQTTEAVGDKFITRPENITRGYMVLLNTGLTLSPTQWWTSISDILLSRIGLDGQAYTEKLNPNTYVARINLLNQFRFSKTLSGELGGYYASVDLNGQAFTDAMWRANLGVQKKILNDKGSIRFTIDDIFHSWIYHNRSVSLKQARFFQTSESDTQRFGLAFNYRFGKETFARKRKHTNSASDEEKGRVD